MTIVSFRVPPPGRATKGSKLSWQVTNCIDFEWSIFLFFSQSPKSRLEITPVTEILVDGDGSLDTERDQQTTSLASPTYTLPTHENEKLKETIQTYEKRIQALTDGISMLKEQVIEQNSFFCEISLQFIRIKMHQQGNSERTDQLRSDIDASLAELEQLQKNHAQLIASRATRSSRSQSPSPIRKPYRSSSADEQRSRRSPTPKVSFQDDPIIEK